MDDGDYEEALEFFALIDKDWESYDEVDGLIEQCKESLTEEVLAEADDYLEEGKEDKALDSLVQALKITGPNKEIEQKIQSILKKNISKSKKTRGNTE